MNSKSKLSILPSVVVLPDGSEIILDDIPEELKTKVLSAIRQNAEGQLSVSPPILEPTTSEPPDALR